MTFSCLSMHIWCNCVISELQIDVLRLGKARLVPGSAAGKSSVKPPRPGRWQSNHSYIHVPQGFILIFFSSRYFLQSCLDSNLCSRETKLVVRQPIEPSERPSLVYITPIWWRFLKRYMISWSYDLTLTWLSIVHSCRRLRLVPIYLIFLLGMRAFAFCPARYQLYGAFYDCDTFLCICIIITVSRCNS